MKAPAGSRTKPEKKFVLGYRAFAAISAIEGLSLDSEGLQRRELTRSLPSSDRRAKTIQAFKRLRKRG